MLNVLMISSGLADKLMFKDGLKAQLKELLVVAVLNQTFGKSNKISQAYTLHPCNKYG